MQSIENVENVVNPPQNPVPRNRTADSFFIKPKITVPKKKEPTKFTIKVAMGNPELPIGKKCPIMNLAIVPRKPPRPTTRAYLMIIFFEVFG